MPKKVSTWEPMIMEQKQQHEAVERHLAAIVARACGGASRVIW